MMCPVGTPLTGGAVTMPITVKIAGIPMMTPAAIQGPGLRGRMARGLGAVLGTSLSAFSSGPPLLGLGAVLGSVSGEVIVLHIRAHVPGDERERSLDRAVDFLGDV